jgi:Domain of unknown function (DUF4272)
VNLDYQAVKSKSEEIISALGGRVCDWLPVLDHTEPRESSAVADRALVLNAIIQIYFGAPVHIVSEWIRDNQLEESLSHNDRHVLGAKAEELTEQQRTNLFWYIEALWALAWSGQLTEELRIDKPVGDNLASLMPDLRVNEDGRKFRQRFKLRPFVEIHVMLDLYYRAHWYARDGHLNGYSTGVFNLDSIMERRRSLEWICDRTIGDWEDTPDGT